MGDGEVQGEARMRGTGGTAVLQRGVPYTTSGAPAAVDVAGASKVCCCLCLFLRDVVRCPGRRSGRLLHPFENLQPNARVAVDAGERATRGERGERPTTASCPRKVGKVQQ